jgi:phospholipase C
MTSSKISRRQFVQLAAASALFGLEMLESSSSARAAEVKDYLARFEYVVVLMLENRSFDNMLGYLYQDDPNKAFNGVYGKQLSNPIPPFADRAAEFGIVPVRQGTFPENPCPDPGEEYPRVNTQLFGTVNPIQNRVTDALYMRAPFNLPGSLPNDAPIPLMNGFVYDYINNFEHTVGRAPSYDEYKVIMECFAPPTVPVISTLAREFAVCDNWFCSVPTQTFANRSFFHSATSSGLVLNAPYADWLTANRAETIFERLQNNGLNWRVYYDAQDVIPVTGAIHYSRLQKFLPTNFSHMDRFFADVAQGTLPRYSFIEPRMFRNHNDQHPPAIVGNKLQHSSVLAGELLIHQIYSAIRESNSERGSNFANTLFIITYDEHGGCYDHVAPPLVPQPDPAMPTAQMAFRFNRLGVRVPAILISSHIAQNTVYSKPLHHNSLMKTMSLKWNLGFLTDRDRTAPDFADVFSLEKPRTREEWPVTSPRPVEQMTDTMSFPLNQLQSSIFQTVEKIAQSQGLTLPRVATIGEALFHMKRVIPSSN